MAAIEPPSLDGMDTAEPEAHVEELLARLRSSREGLTAREAARRLLQYGPNALRRRAGMQWPRDDELEAT